MKYLSWIFALLLPSLTHANVLATCSSKIDHAFYPYMGIVPDLKSGWHVSPPGGTVTLMQLSNGSFDIEYVDASKEPQSARQMKGYSQENFAYEVGLDRTYMGSVERGERNLAAINLIRIAKALKIEVGDLFPAIRTLCID